MSGKRPRPSAQAPGRADAGDLAEQASAALAAGHYREAIEAYKALLKQARSDAALQGLAAAYAGRAEQLAAKSMFKEAAALWRTRAEVCGLPPLAACYLRWLQAAGETAQIPALLAGLGRLAPEALAEAERQCAAVALMATPAQLALLPADSALRRHHAHAQAALAASVACDSEKLDAALREIPHRSPYRDLRLLLKALAQRVSDPAAAADALARVPESGPFATLAQALHVALQPGLRWLESWPGLAPAQRELVFDLRGVPAPQRPLVAALAQHGALDAPDAQGLYDLLLQQRRVLPAAVLRPLCRALLPSLPRAADAFDTMFEPRTPAEQDRDAALAAEQRRDPEVAERAWLRLVDRLARVPAQHAAAAAILRRLVSKNHLDHVESRLDEPARRWLARSLELDPAHRDSHLRLLRDARWHEDLREARRLLEAASKQFPDDLAVLQEALEIALAADAFKKAAGLAKQILARDPINPRVPALIGQAHLSHARKRLGARDYAATERELEAAEPWLQGTPAAAELQLLRGLLAVSPGADQRTPATTYATAAVAASRATNVAANAAADALLRQALGSLAGVAGGGTLVPGFLLLREARRVRQDGGALLKRLKWDRNDKPPTAAEVAALASHLQPLQADDRDVKAAVDQLRPQLKRVTAAVCGSEQEQLQLCETLLAHGLPQLASGFALVAQPRWPKQPLFVALELLTKHRGQPWRMPARSRARLDQAIDQIEQQGDPRMLQRLRDLLYDGPPLYLPDFEDSIPDELPPLPPGAVAGAREMFETMLALEGPQALLKALRQQLGKAEFAELRRSLGGDDLTFAKRLIDMLAVEPAGSAGSAGSAGKAAPWPGAVSKPRAPARRPKPRGQKDLFDD